MSSIPVTVRLAPDEFDQLEVIAERRGVTVRQLLQAHVRAGLKPTRVVRTTRPNQGPQRAFTDADIARWVQQAEAGMTNNEIAEQAGVSKSLVSRYLIERGVRRNRTRRKQTA